MSDRPKLTPGKDASIAILVLDQTNPFAVIDAVGLTVKAYLSETKGGPPIDETLSYTATEKPDPVPGIRGRLYLLAVTGTTTRALLLPFLDDSVFVCATANDQPLEVIQVDVVRAEDE